MKKIVIETKPGDEHFYLFESIPSKIYPPGSLRLKQSDTINEEFIHLCVVLLINEEPVGRLAIYMNPHLYFEGKTTSCIGNYECIDDIDVASDLILYAEQIIQKLNAQYIIGPMNGSTWDNYRFSTDHAHPNFLLEAFHHLYYKDQFLNSGFQTIGKYYSSLDHEVTCDYPAILELEKKLEAEGMSVRSIDINDYTNELKKLFPFILEAFKTNFLYTSITWESFLKKYSEAIKLINPEFVLIAEDNEKNIIGFIFCYEDPYNTNRKTIVVKTLVRSESKKWHGLGQVIGNKVMRRAKEKGFTACLHAFMYEQGTSKKASTNFQGKIFKRYELYGKSINLIV